MRYTAGHPGHSLGADLCENLVKAGVVLRGCGTAPRRIPKPDPGYRHTRALRRSGMPPFPQSPGAEPRSVGYGSLFFGFGFPSVRTPQSKAAPNHPRQLVPRLLPPRICSPADTTNRDRRAPRAPPDSTPPRARKFCARFCESFRRRQVKGEKCSCLWVDRVQVDCFAIDSSIA